MNNSFFQNTWKHRAHVMMSLPAFLIILLFYYVPMSGLVLAFKNLDYAKGIWNSDWVGFENFRFLFLNGKTFWRCTGNTIKYYIIFTIIGTILNLTLAIAIDQFAHKKLGKLYHSILIIPVFVSYMAVRFIVEAFLSTDKGLINSLIVNMGGTKIRWYMTPKYWTIILTVVRMWHDVGYGSVLYMAVLAGIDQELYDAAQIDGANKRQQIFRITIPFLIPMVTIMILLGVGNIMHSDTGIFYQVTRNAGLLFPTTQVLDSYILDAIRTTSSFGTLAAATFYQSIVGCLLMLGANGIVRKLAPENALF